MSLGKPYHRLMHNKSWGKFIKNDSNKSQTEKRIQNGAIVRMEELSNLSKLLPEHLQMEIYSSKRIERFVMNLLNIRSDVLGFGIEYQQELDGRRCNLAAKMVELCISLCVSQFELMFREHPALANPTIKHLKESIDICKAIAYKIELDNQITYAKGKNMMYLFNWTQITTRDKDRFEEFVSEVVGIQQSLELLQVKTQTPDSLSCLLGDKELGIGIEVEIKLDTIHGIATVTIKDKERVKPIKLRLKTDGENIRIYQNRIQT